MVYRILIPQDDFCVFWALYQNNGVFRRLQQHSQISTGHEL